MKLVEFEVSNYRSIDSSGPIKVGKVTSLVGRNESGKTNLLLALQSLNPPGGRRDLSAIKDFPRHRRLSDCNDSTPVLETVWELDQKERAKLVAIFPRAKATTKVRIGRRYNKANPCRVDLEGLRGLDFDITGLVSRAKRIKTAIAPSLGKLEPTQRKQVEEAFEVLEACSSGDGEAKDWAGAAGPALADLRKKVAAAGIALAAKEEKLLGELEDTAASILADDKSWAEARSWALSLVPVFVYVDEYPEIDGHHNVAEFLQRRSTNQLSASDRNFEKLCKVADLDPGWLELLLSQNDHETRNQLANRAGAVITGEIRRLWKDRALKVRFNPDAHHLDTFVSDPNAVYDVEVNLDERSRGFKWFFSFYVTFAADTKGGSAENAILLLDEPGLYLHASSQRDLLRHLSTDFQNQTLYTTHSPFMVPTENLDAVRTVNIGQDTGTTVTNDPTGDARTLFPLQAALGFTIAQSLFIGPANLVVEGVTDYWILSSISEHLLSIGKTGLPRDLAITPAGGAQKVTYMVALLTSERLNVMVLLDDERGARNAAAELVKQKLICDDNIVFITDGFGDGGPSEADVEDLLDPAVYRQLVEQSYAKELGGRSLHLNAKIPRIVRRYGEAFAGIDIDFQKTRPARLLLRVMAEDPERIVTPTTLERFERLFGKVGEQLRRHLARDTKPFQ